MSVRPTPEQLDRLPKYAQQYIEQLERERAAAAECLRKMEDDQTPTKVKTETFESIGEKERGPTMVTRYFPCDHLEITQGGVTLSINSLFGEGGSMRLSWRPAGPGFSLGTIAFVPMSHQQATLVNLAYDKQEFDRLVKQKERCDAE